jgi:hypothetical protein
MKLSIRIGVLLSVVLLAPALLVAQKQTRTVFVTAVDQKGAPVLDLTTADFEVVEGVTTKSITSAGLANGPMRILLLIDTSETVNPFQGQMKPALTAFIDAIPEKHEIGIMSMGRQFRVRQAPTTDRAKLKSTANSFSLDGGGTPFFDSLREAESRFQKKEGVRWPVYVMFMADGSESSGVIVSDEFSRMTTDMVLRATTVHGAVVERTGPTPATDIVSRLARGTGGAFEQVTTPVSLIEKMKIIAARIVSDAEKMSTRYQLSYTSDAKYTGEMDVHVLREGIKGSVSVRRSF